MKTVVLFDGVCNLCHRTVQFILRHDKSQRFVFASQQSEVGQQLLRRYGIPTETALADSVVVVEEGRVWLESDAALHILYRLGGVWRIPALLRWVPKGLRDWVYRLVAKNRYRLFGRLERCMVPTPELKERFLDAS